MANSINTNIAAYFAQANISTAASAASSSVARLSSGNRIVQASDDVAALAIGASLSTQISGLKTALTNASQGTSLLQVADGTLAQIQSILQQQQSIAQQAGSGSLTDTNRGFLNQQFQALSAQINILAKGASFNGVTLLDGSIAHGGSNNPLRDAAIVPETTDITPAGFTDASDSPTAGAVNTYGTFTNAAIGFTAATAITQPTGAYDQDLYGDLNADGIFTVQAHDAGFDGYDVTYTINGVTYSGTLASSSHDGKVAVGATLTLTATTDAANHATIAFTVSSTGWTAAGDNSFDIKTKLNANVASVELHSAGFTAAPTITQPTGPNGDPSLYGNLANGTFSVQAGVNVTTPGTVGTGGTAKGYIINYTLNGTTWTGFIANDNTAGHGIVAAAATVTLSTGDNATHATIGLTVGANAFGVSNTVDQSANIKQALEANFAGATAFNATAAATIGGEAGQTGIGSAAFYNNPGKNDTSFVGDLSAGVFQVTGDAVAGYSVSYSLNGATYQGFLSGDAVTNGGKLVLDGGDGTVVFTISDSTGNTSTATSTAFQSALTAQFAAATAYAVHHVKSDELALDVNGNEIAGSAILATDTAGTLLNGFDGSDITIQSALFDADQLPPISNWSATGSGANTVFTVQVNGQTYSTDGSTVTNSTTLLNAANFGNGNGHLRVFANGDNTSKEYIDLDLTGLSAGALITTEDSVQNIVDALNNAFGSSGGGSGGLTFQLGTTSASNVTVNIANAQTSALFNGATLNISTQGGASLASATVATALNSLTAIRSNVGALQTQFQFASAALQVSVQNQVAAQSQILDTDIASESTAFATSQVKLQAGISVLAQANQQLQALLKLIG